jgi:hypothetical protein
MDSGQKSAGQHILKSVLVLVRQVHCTATRVAVYQHGIIELTTCISKVAFMLGILVLTRDIVACVRCSVPVASETKNYVHVYEHRRMRDG